MRPPALDTVPSVSYFTYEEWKGYEYLMDNEFAALGGFLSPSGRAQGIYWVEEFLARVESHFVNKPASQTGYNMTLDTNAVTFPLNQSLYQEFTHDANIVSVLTAFGFTHFTDFLPFDGPSKSQQCIISKRVTFSNQLNIEIIKLPQKVSPSRSEEANKRTDYIAGTGETQYIHFFPESADYHATCHFSSV